MRWSYLIISLLFTTMGLTLLYRGDIHGFLLAEAVAQLVLIDGRLDK